MNEKGTQAAAATAYEKAVAADFRRNVTAMVGWECLWGLGIPFALYWTLVPAYLQHLHAPKALIGLVLAFPTLFAPMGIMGGYLVPARIRVRCIQAVYVLAILPWWTYALGSLLLGGAWAPTLHYALFATVAALFMLGMTSIGAMYHEVMTDNTPRKRRGRLLGYRAAGVGLTGMLMGFVAVRVLDYWPAPKGYRVSFLIGTSIYLVSCAALWIVRDHVNPSHTQDEDTRPDMRQWLRESLAHVWDEPNYRVFLFFYALLWITVMGSGLIIAAAGDVLEATPRQQGIFSVVYLGTVAGGGWIVGWVADHYGYRMTGFVMALLALCAYSLVLAFRSIEVWYVAYGATAVCSVSLPSVLCSMGAELCTSVRPSRLMALANSLALLVVVPTVTIFGRVVDATGRYSEVFTAMIVISAVAAMGLAFLVKEPRRGRLYMIKYLARL